MRRTFFPAFILVGITSTLSQTLFTRALIQVFYGNELCLGVIFSGWLFFTGIGSIIGRKIQKILFPEFMLSLSIILILEFLLVKSIKNILNIRMGELIGPVPMILFSFFTLAPLCFIMGILFVQGCKLYHSRGAGEQGSKGESPQHLRSSAPLLKTEAITSVYILDAIGDMLGGILFAYLFIHFFSLTTLFLFCLFNIFMAWIIKNPTLNLIQGEIRNPKYRLFSAYCLLLTTYCILGLFFAKNIEQMIIKQAYKGYNVVSCKRSIYGDIVVINRDNLYSLYQNGVLSFTTPTPLIAEETVHFPALMYKCGIKDMKRILVLGGTLEVLNELLKYNPEIVYYVEIDKKLVEQADSLCRQNLPDGSQAGKMPISPKVKRVYQDGRKFVKKYTGERFDLIIINVGDPSTALTNRFYTVEFFEETRDILKEQGILALSLASNPNYLSSGFLLFNGTIYKTLKQVFPHIIIVPGEEMSLFAGKSGDYMTDSVEILKQRWETIASKVTTKYVTKSYIPSRFYKERIDYVRKTLDAFTPQQLNRDFRPISYYYSILLTGSYFSSVFRKIFMGIAKIPFLLMCIMIIFITILLGLFSNKASFSVGGFGAIGIGSQLIILLSFESLCGYMYHKIGIITGAFMLGVSLGALKSSRFIVHGSQKKNLNSQLLTVNRQLLTITGLSFLYLIILFLTLRFLFLKGTGFEFIFPIFSCAGGLLVGALFPIANAILIKQGETVQRSAGLLYGVDLFTSCIFSLLTTVFFVPIYGIDKTLLVLIILNLIILAKVLKS